MSDAAQEPPWDRLPADPLGFFGLEPGFDPQELRRRYGRLIKQYRPERDPEAFQRIRAAYESLTSEAQAPLVPRVPLGGDAPATGDEQGPGEGLVSRLRGQEGAAVLEALRGAPARTLEERLARALMEGKSAAVDHLYAALTELPGEPHLLALLGAHLAQLPPEQAEGALRRAATALPPGAFARASVGLWRAWTRQGEPERVEAVWSELVASRPAAASSALLCAVLRPAALRLSDAWLEAATARLREVDPRSEQRGHERELELLAALRAYRAARERFLADGSPGRRRLDELLLALVDGEPDAATRLLRFLGDVHDEPDLALELLPFDSLEALLAVEALTWLCWDLVAQGLIEPGRPAAIGEEDRGRGRLYALLARRWWLSARFGLGAATILCVYLAPLVGLGVLATIPGRVFSPSVVVAIALLGLAGTVRELLRYLKRFAAHARARAISSSWRAVERRRALGAVVGWGGVDLRRALDDAEEGLRPLALDPGLRLLALSAGWASA